MNITHSILFVFRFYDFFHIYSSSILFTFTLCKGTSFVLLIILMYGIKRVKQISYKIDDSQTKWHPKIESIAWCSIWLKFARRVVNWDNIVNSKCIHQMTLNLSFTLNGIYIWNRNTQTDVPNRAKTVKVLTFIHFAWQPQSRENKHKCN